MSLTSKTLSTLPYAKFEKLNIMFSYANISDEMEVGILLFDNTNFKRDPHVNVYGAFLAIKHGAWVMILAKTRCIIFTSNVVSVFLEGDIYGYVASKHVVVGLGNNLCVELGHYGIRVTCISSFAVATHTLSTIL